MSEDMQHADSLSILFSFLNSATAFGGSMKEYSEKYGGKPHKDVVMDMIKNYQGVNFLNHNGNVADYLIDTFVPGQYRTLARGIKKLPLPQFLDIASSILKKYGEDGNGGYKTAEDFIEDLIKEQAKRMFLKR